MKTRNSFFKVSLIIATVTMMVMLTTQITTAQGWYNPSWQYGRAVTIPNPGTTTLTDFQVKITLNSSTPFDFSKAQNDGSDVRITSDNGTTLIPFWIESWNDETQQATIWVKVPNIPASGTTTIYLYYGNGSATCTSDGTSTFNFFDDFESWNTTPSSSAWQDLTLLPTASADLTAAVYNGKLYSFGGYGSNSGNYLNTVHEYNPSTNTWTVKSPMPTARWGMVSVEFNGKIYVFGGQGTVNYKNEVYDPVNNTWETKTNIPAGLAQQGLMGVKLGDKIHLFYQSSHYEYDPATDTYLAKANVPTPRTWSTVGVVNNMIYVIGGYSYGSPSGATTVNEMYDPLTNIWTTKVPLPIAIWGATRENPVIDGKIFVTHGHNGSVFFATNYIYDPSANTWEQKGPAAHPRDGVACGLISNKLYVVGGRDVVSGPYGLTWNEVYDPLLDTWTPSQPGPLQWSTSGPGSVFADGSAKYRGNYGLKITQSSGSTFRYAESILGYGDIYALDFNWNVTEMNGIGGTQPETEIRLTEVPVINGNLFFYNENGVQVLRWFNGSGFNHLQNGTRNSWHNVTLVRNGIDSRVIFDGNSYTSPLITSTGTQGTGKFRFGQYFATTQYLDNVRVRQWAGADPTTVVLGEQSPGPPILITTDLITDVSCNDGSNGAIDISVSGGTAPYDYSYEWTASSGGVVPVDQINDQDLTDLVAGTYSVTVTDQYISEASQSFTITQPTAVVVSATHTEIICTGGTSILTASASGGTPGNPAYTYSINGIDYQASPDFTLLAGPYTVYAKDSKGCTGNISGTIGTPVAWYDESWQYRRSLAITNSGSSGLSNFQVKITLNSTFDFNKAMVDGRDIMFTLSDGTTTIPYWIESWDKVGTQATIWVKMPTIPSSGTSIFLYYGNSAATSASNGSSTFDFFDDFESWASPSNAWADKALLPTPKADHTCAVYNGKLYAIGGYNLTAGDARAENYEYNPATNSWAVKTPMPTPRWGPIAVEFNGKIYVFGGQLSNGAGTAKNEMYDPVNDTWTGSSLGNPLLIPDYGASGVVHPDVIYFPEGKDGYKYWMTYTPYPPQPDENPSIVRSNDGITWTGNGITNPVIPEGTSGSWNDLENPDPDFIYVSAIDKWFLVWNGGDEATNSRKIALAYSSDGKTWTQYDGSPVNGNTNPVILSGTDSQGQAWETDGTYSKTSCPTLFYEDGIFYLYYVEEASGNNNGYAGFATFTWNNTTNSLENLQRSSGNPTITKRGGHINLSKNPNNGNYYMHHVVGTNLELMTSADLINWTDLGTVLEPGISGQWDGSLIYRSCPVVDKNGSIVLFEDNIRIYYSANGSIQFGIGMADILPDGSVQKFQSGGGLNDMPSSLGAQGLMGVKYGDKIHLFYKHAHYEYDPVYDTYTPKADLPTGRTWSTCGVVGNKIYVIGGYSYDNPCCATNVNEIYDPVTDTWSVGAPMPVSKYGITRENPVINGKIYVTHGLDGGFHVDNFMYDPATNTWQQKQSATDLRDGTGCGVIDNKLYVTGGRADYAGPYGTSFNEVYDPSLDTWSTLPGSSLWSTSGTGYVFTDGSAKYQGNYGLVVQQTANMTDLRYAETVQGFGDVYALDLSWNLTDDGGTGTEPRPQGVIFLSPSSFYERLFFYNLDGIPAVRWYDGSFITLTNSVYNNWHKLTMIRNGANSRVLFDGAPFNVTPGSSGGTGQIRLAVHWATKQYFDNVRVRKWSTPEPSFTMGSEISLFKALETHTDILCYGDNSTVTITATGGALPYNGTGIFIQPAGEVTYTVTDSKGCFSEVTVNIIQPDAISISGYFSYFNSSNTPMGNLSVTLLGSSLPSTTTSIVPAGPENKIGYFTFSNVCPGTYNVEVNSAYPADGINSTDAAQVNYWGTGGLSYPIERVRFLSGDVTFDNNIASADAGRILQYFLTQGNTPLSSPWCFWKTGEEMIGSNPWTFGNLSITVTGSSVSQNFYGLATGDFNRSYIPGSLKSGSESLMLLYGETLEVIPGMEFQLPLSAVMDMEVGAVSLIIDFPSDLLEVNGVYLSDDPDVPLLYAVSGDELRIAWNSLDPVFVSEGESLLTLLVKVKDLTPEEGIRIKLASDPLNELADGNYEVISDAVLSVDIVKTVTTGTGEITLSDRLSLANHPNPFTGKTTFVYSLPVDGKVTLEIYDIVGNKVKSLVDEVQSAGDYQLKIDEKSLQAGVYTATLKLDSNGNLMTRTIKIICKY